MNGCAPKHSVFVTPAKAGVQLVKHSGFRPRRNDDSFVIQKLLELQRTLIQFIAPRPGDLHGQLHRLLERQFL